MFVFFISTIFPPTSSTPTHTVIIQIPRNKSHRAQLSVKPAYARNASTITTDSYLSLSLKLLVVGGALHHLARDIARRRWRRPRSARAVPLTGGRLSQPPPPRDPRSRTSCEASPLCDINERIVDPGPPFVSLRFHY